MADIPITEIGVGGAIAVIIIREFITYVKVTRKSGDHVTRDEFEKHKESVQYKDTCREIVTRIDGGFAEIKDDFKEVKDLIRNGGK